MFSKVFETRSFLKNVSGRLFGHVHASHVITHRLLLQATTTKEKKMVGKCISNLNEQI
jgi:hypothetical protein